MRCEQTALVLWLSAVAAVAGEAPPAPFASLQAGDALVRLQRDGRFSLVCADRVLVPEARIVVAAPDWKGSGDQAACRVLDGYPRTEDGVFVFRGEIEEPVSKTAWRFEERVAGAEGGIRFIFSIEPLADAKAAEISLFVDLPLDLWRGKKALLWPGAEAVFPEQAPRERHFLSGVARRAVLGVGAERQVTLDFARPTYCTVQDCREFGRPFYQLYPRLFRGGAAARGQKQSLEFTLLPNDKRRYEMVTADYSSTEPLRVGPLKLPAQAVPVFSRFEIGLDVAGTFKTPFDPDEMRVDGHFRAPSGRETVVPAFFSQDFALTVQDGESLLEPRGKPAWRLRFAAVEPGRHSLFVTARDRSGEARSEAVALDATPSADPGYIRVSRGDPRYFAFDSGKPYFAVGENVCTWQHGVADYDTWLPRLGAAGGNYARIWMWGHCFGVEWGRPGQYRLDHAWALDHAMALAEKHGIYVKLCLEAWRGFSGNGSFVAPGALHPYWKQNGGPCDAEMDVFTNPEARRMFRNRLRYVVARWGYSTHILAWEFWNEINCVRGFGPRSQDMIHWSAEMGRYLHETDPWRHLVVNSLGSFEVDDRLWKLPEMDFAQVHGYWHPNHAASKEMAKDMAEFVPHWIGRIGGYGKPALFAEYGLVNDRWGPSPRADEDKEGVHLHNGLWSAAMSGAAGTAMLWWWGNYVDPNDLYYHFAAVARFTDGVPWTTAGFQPAKASADSPQLRVLGLQGKDLVLLWLHNRRHTWWNVVEKQPIPAIEAAKVTLAGLTDGAWDVEWWDTWKGTVTRKETLQAAQGALTLEVKALARDAALKLRRR